MEMRFAIGQIIYTASMTLHEIKIWRGSPVNLFNLLIFFLQFFLIFPYANRKFCVQFFFLVYKFNMQSILKTVSFFECQWNFQKISQFFENWLIAVNVTCVDSFFYCKCTVMWSASGKPQEFSSIVLTCLSYFMKLEIFKM